MGSARFANLGRVFSVAYSDDSRLVAGGAWDGSIRVWEVATGKEVLATQEHKGPVRKVAFAHDGRWMVSAGQAPGVCLWDLQAGRLARVLGSPSDGRADVAFAPDDKHIAAISRGRLLVWDRDGKLLWSQGGDRIHTRLAFRTADSVSSMYIKPLGRFGKQLVPDAKSRVYLSTWQLSSGKESDPLDLGPLNEIGPPALGAGGLVVEHTAQRRGQREQITYFQPGRRDAARRIELPEQEVSELCVSPDSRMIALCGNSWSRDRDDRMPKFIRVFEAATGQERCRFQSVDTGQLSLAFSPDGRSLASGSLDVTVLVWDLTGGDTGATRPLTEGDLGKLWTDVKGSDAALAYRSHWKLVAAAKQAVPFLAGKMQPVAAPDPKRVAALIRDLAAEQFDTRSAAYTELSKLEDMAEPALRAALPASQSLEARRRIEELLRRIDQLSPERRAQLRAIEGLEHMHTRAAGALLRGLATGAPAASVTRAAADAVRRLR